jgi:hypothetical protein
VQCLGRLSQVEVASDSFLYKFELVQVHGGKWCALCASGQ